MTIKGDINGDGKIDLYDLLLMQAYLLGYTELTPEQFSAADINGDGEVDGIDLGALNMHLLNIRTINEVIY